jgi:hypothetical protein
MAKTLEGQLVPLERIESRIFVLRGHRVMLDRHLAELYGVALKRLNEQVKRNRERFPDDFMFQLTLEEGKAVRLSRSQIATLKRGQNIKYAPHVFTEHGAVMLVEFTVLRFWEVETGANMGVMLFPKRGSIPISHHFSCLYGFLGFAKIDFRHFPRTRSRSPCKLFIQRQKPSRL